MSDSRDRDSTASAPTEAPGETNRPAPEPETSPSSRPLSAHERALGSGAMRFAPPPTQRISRAHFVPVQIRIGEDECHDLARAAKKEWLVANGIGGYAMSTVVGLNTRREHGLLVAATRGLAGRNVVLSKMEETVVIPGATRSLDTTFYPGVVHPRGFELSSSFRLYPFPTFVFAGQRWRLEKHVALVHGENTVVVTYRMQPLPKRRPDNPRRAESTTTASAEAKAQPPAAGSSSNRAAADGANADVAAAGENRVTAGPVVPSRIPGSRGPVVDPAASTPAATDPGALGPVESLKLRVRPLFAFRDVSQLGERNERIQKTFGSRGVGERGSVVRCTPYPNWEPVYLVCNEATFVEGPDWYKRVEYPQDRYRGLDYSEDLWSYGYYEIDMHMGDSLTIACTMHPPETHATQWSEEREVIRLAQVMAKAPDETPFARRLVLAADQFVVRRERDVPALIAGYPYLADHVRDTLVAMPGLLLVTGRHRDAKTILRAYARALQRGLLPKRFYDGTRPEYGNVDATLWFFVAVFKYLQYTGDFDFVRTELRIPLLEVMRYFQEGTRFGVRVDRDGLIQCGEPGIALTWMDARVGDQPVTRRDGKPVELNALWYNALKIMERLAERFSIPNDMARFARRAEQVEASFYASFWNPDLGCLHDLVTAAGPDSAIRANQIMAVSLPFPLLDSESAESVVDVVGRKLLTPLGLRTLDASHPMFRPTYDGDENERARAAHQGTAWTWLLGAYITALVKCRGEAGRAEAARILDPIQRHLTDDCLGQVSEKSWGSAPHWPRGCPAAAAGVGEVLRCYYEDVLGRNPGVRSPIVPPPLRKR